MSTKLRKDNGEFITGQEISDGKMPLDVSTLDPAPDARVTADATMPINAVAVSRVVVGTYDAAATVSTTIILGGLEIPTNDLVDIATLEATVASVVTYINGSDPPRYEMIPTALPAVDNEDGTFTVTLEPGLDGNDLVFSTDDPALTFDDVTDGADAEPFKATVGQVNGCLRYVAAMTQSGTSAPVMQVFVNEPNFPDPIYGNVGAYNIPLSPAIALNRLWIGGMAPSINGDFAVIPISTGTVAGYFSILFDDDPVTTIEFKFFDPAGDPIEFNTLFSTGQFYLPEIRVYPAP